MPTPHERMLEDIKHPLMIALIKRLAGVGRELFIPMSELQATRSEMLMLRFHDDKSGFTFSVEPAPTPDFKPPSF